MARSRFGTLDGIVLLAAMTPALLSFAAGPSPATTDAQFVKMDTNKDGRISPEEHAAGAKHMFDTMDGNKDGKVTAAEMTASHQRVTGSKATKADMSAAEKIKVVDANGDGVLSTEEHAVGSRAMFEKMDTDKDGFLTKSELAAGHAQMLKKSSR